MRDLLKYERALLLKVKASYAQLLTKNPFLPLWVMEIVEN